MQPLRKALGGSVVGTIVEYYDFGVYGYMATVLAGLFFSTGDPGTALLSTLATFAVAFFLRIPGGLLFGHIGDKYGRKKALSWTILLMCIATLGDRVDAHLRDAGDLGDHSFGAGPMPAGPGRRW